MWNRIFSLDVMDETSQNKKDELGSRCIKSADIPGNYLILADDNYIQPTGDPSAQSLPSSMSCITVQGQR